MNIKNIIFDFGGVLIDWNPRYLYSNVFHDEVEMEFFLNKVCSPEWNLKQDAGYSFNEAIKELTIKFPQYENETDKYFEFVRVNIQNEKDKILSRIHRADYFISHYDKFTDIDVVGIFNGDLSLSNTKELIEYLWSCGTLGLHDKVVESKITEKKNIFEYHVQSLRIVYGDFGLHDVIYVYDNYFHLDISTKILTVNREQIKEIEGNYNEGW